MIKKIFLIFFIFLYLINFAYAQDYAFFSGKFYDLKHGEEKIEFEPYNKTYNICENEKKAIPILVVNKDTKTDNKYSLYIAGATWIKLNVEEFLLPKKESGVIFLELNPGQNTQGLYNIKLSGLSSIGNVRKDLRLDINVKKCYSLNLELEKEEDKICGGIKKQYIGEIINDGEQKIDVELALKGPNWVSVDESIFSVGSNDKQKFELNADVPSNAKGVFNVIVTALIKNLSSIKSEKKLSIDVVPKHDCRKADIIIPDERIKNYYFNVYISIKIRNNGIKQAEYEVSLEAPNWITIEPKKLTINPEQFGNLNLNVNPNEEVNEGTYKIKINVKSDDIVYSKNINVVLSKNKWKNVKLFFVFYQYYIYVLLFILVILFILRRRIINKIKAKYKNYKIKRLRLKALGVARKARAKKQIKKSGFEVKKFKKYKNKWFLFLIVLLIISSVLSFPIYQFDFPVSKEFVKNYYIYFIIGILISLFIIFLFEFYRPLFRLLKSLNKSKKKIRKKQ